ncbi:MAG TPA: hypothetical protein P5096_03135 [Patescibacteria group bacterium]|nr:hypothetical protein [Patescibacteria group bacterium]
MGNTDEQKDSIMDDEKFINFMESRDEKLVDFLTTKFGAIDGRFEKIEGRLDRIETTMVTKSFLTDVMANFRVETNEKVYKTVEILKEKKVFDDKDIKRVKEAGVAVK